MAMAYVQHYDKGHDCVDQRYGQRPMARNDSVMPQSQMPHSQNYTQQQHSHTVAPHWQTQQYSPDYVPDLPPQYDSIPHQHAPTAGRLVKPVAIPATQAALGSPFLRAYPPVLAQFNISRETFLRFLDGMNRAAVASPPIQVLGLAGNIVGMVPLHTAQIVGGAVNMAAKVGTVAVSKGRLEMELREANRQLFHPRGLDVQIAKLNALAAMAKIPVLDADGEVNDSSILRPFDDDTDATTLPAQHRRIQALQPWIQELQVDGLPAAEAQTNMLSRIHASASERQRRKEDEKLIKGRAKAHEEYGKDCRKMDRECAKKMRELMRDEEKARERGKQERLREIEQKMARLQDKYDAKKRGAESKGEEKALRKIFFITITSL